MIASRGRPESSTRERIVAATLGLIGERGVGGVTMTAVADGAGVARQTLYNHFPDVDSILGAALEAHQAAGADALRAMLTTIPSPRGRLEILVRDAVVTAAQHGSVPELHGGLSARTRAAVEAREREVLALVAAVLREGKAAREFRDSVDPGRDAALVVALLDGAARLAAEAPDDAADIAAATLRMVLGAVGASSA